MKNYQVFKHPTKGYRAVKMGLCWPAAFFGFWWSVFSGLWMIAPLMFICGIIVFAISKTEPVFGLFLGFLAGFVSLCYGNDWRVRSLRSKGFEPVGIRSTSTAEEAIQRIHDDNAA